LSQIEIEIVFPTVWGFWCDLALFWFLVVGAGISVLPPFSTAYNFAYLSAKGLRIVFLHLHLLRLALFLARGSSVAGLGFQAAGCRPIGGAPNCCSEESQEIERGAWVEECSA